MPPRFVILHHTGFGVEHWDLMLQRGEVLWTWQLERNPVGLRAEPIRARRIGDHRVRYLDYEGPVSGGRGVVRRADRGELDWIDVGEAGVIFRLRGGHLDGHFELRAGSTGESWFFSRGGTIEG